MMGGSGSHEFMALAECGEDTIFVSPDGQYRANREIATTALTFVRGEPLPLEKVHTPGRKSIEEVAAFLGVDSSRTGKAVFYATPEDNLVFALIRGDLEINETKLRNFLRVPELRFATDEEITACGAVPGYASITGLDTERVRIVVDPSAAESGNLVVGANEVDYHYLNFNLDRDVSRPVDVTDIALAREGDPCPVTGEPLRMVRGIEVGNIFKLGTKYSAAMGAQFLDRNGKSHPMIMGCYGIGIGRTMAAVIEQSHDKYGPIWPLSIAPYHVHIVALNPNKEGVGEVCDGLYTELGDLGIEVLYDDRGEKAGVAFNDADLIGVPIRLIVSPKTAPNGEVEVKTRDGQASEVVPRDRVVARVRELMAERA
jgi:prolyl-tRNA synthetase